MTIEEAKEILQMEVDWDWEKFRREAAKDILAGMLSAPALINIGGKQLKTFTDFANAAIGIADTLIAKLKEQ